MGRADPGTVISELLSVQKLVALAGSLKAPALGEVAYARTLFEVRSRVILR